MAFLCLIGSSATALSACSDTGSATNIAGPLIGVTGGSAWLSPASHELRVFVDSTEKVTGLEFSRLTSARAGFRRPSNVPVGKRVLPSSSARLRIIDSLASASPGLLVTVYQTARGERVGGRGLSSSVLQTAPSSPAASSDPPATAEEVEAIVDAAVAELESQSNEILAEAEFTAEDDMQQLVQTAGFFGASDRIVDATLCALAICSDIAEKRLQYRTGQQGVVVATAMAVTEVVGAGLIAVAVGSSVGVVAATVGVATVAGLGGQWFAGTSLMEKARALRRCLRGEEVRNKTPAESQARAFATVSSHLPHSLREVTET